MVTVCVLAPKAPVPGEETVSVQVAALVAVIKVAPSTRHGPDSEMLAGAPDPVVVNKVKEAFAGAETVALAGQAALPRTPIERGSGPGAGSTLTAWVPVPLMKLLDALNSAEMIWLPAVAGVHEVEIRPPDSVVLPEMPTWFPLTFVKNETLPWIGDPSEPVA